ncbi:MAG: choline/carnitine O-acyltransferase [Propionibacteriaceae bacterium]|nr:choline/carnitine O-acyltransferase [Propionibacteriaceae bacterium]
MKLLPVPPLTETLDRYLTAASPLLSAEEFDRTEQVVRDYAEGLGKPAQAELERFAEMENAEGRSWLSAAWLKGYLTVRDPLPLSTSVGFRLAWPTSAEGTPAAAFAAEVLHAFASAHLAYVSGEVAPEVTPRGEPVDGSQRVIMAGGIRRPHSGQDDIEPGPWDPRSRDVGVLWQGRWYAVSVSDSDGGLLSRTAIQADLQAILDDAAGADHAGTALDFTAPSYRGGDHAAAALEELLEDEANRRTHNRVRDALFVLHLSDEDLAADGLAADGLAGDALEAEFIRRVAFEPGRAWTWKPLTYQVQLRHGLVALHMEHSLADGGTLLGLVAEAHARVETGERDDATGLPQESRTPDTLAWRISDAQEAELEADLAAYRDRAAPLHVQLVRVPNPIPTGKRISADAVLQWVMLYAQRATYGRVRSTYEAVDMREYQAGRTECLRANTPAAVALVEALLDRPDAEEAATLLATALDAHRGWVKNAKAGNGVDRHLLGLAEAAERLGDATPLHDDEGYRRLSTDFLSTTSLGTRDAVLRCAFAPTSAGGIGLYYVVDGDELEFTVIHRRDEAERIEEFVANLAIGAERLAPVLAAHG